MKKTVLFLFLALAFLANSCKKDETPEFNNISTEHKSLLIDFTATWCCPCGGSIPIFKDIQSRYPYKVVPMAVHAQNDPYYNADMLNFGSNAYDITGIPTYVGDNQVISWGYTQFNTLDTSDFYHVIKTTLAEAPACGIGINKSISGNKMSVSTRTLFFRQTTGKLSLAIYITEDGLQHDQNCSAETVHNHVFRASLTTDVLGKVLVNGSVEKGQTFDNTFTFDIPSDYVKNNLHVIAIVYQLDPSSSATKPLAILNVNNI